MSTVAPPPRHALGLPAGSIRALLAFGVLAYLWVLAVAPGRDPAGVMSAQVSQAFIYLQVLMALIMAHFFVAHGKNIGHGAGPSPLGLPKGTVRLILLAGYIGLAYYLYHQKQQFAIADRIDARVLLLQLVVLLTAFVIGHLITIVMLRVSRGVLPAWFQDIQAWFALLGMILLGVIIITRLVINVSMPLDNQIDPKNLETVLAGIVGFYFGARSS